MMIMMKMKLINLGKFLNEVLLFGNGSKGQVKKVVIANKELKLGEVRKIQKIKRMS